MAGRTKAEILAAHINAYCKIVNSDTTWKEWNSSTVHIRAWRDMPQTKEAVRLWVAKARLLGLTVYGWDD